MNEIFFHDTHLHIDLFKDMNSIMKKIEDQKSYTIAMTNLPELYKKYSKKYGSLKYIRFALGFHPELIAKYSYQIGLFDEEIKNARYVGEIGLDKGKNINDYEKQQELFEHIINECEKTGKKIISIHSRNSATDILNITKKAFNCKVIMHWFSGSMDELDLCIKRDFYFSINPKMLNTKKGRMIIEKVPINRILIESDAPLATENNLYDFIFMKEIIKYVARIKKIDSSKVNNIFRNNFKSLLN